MKGESGRFVLACSDAINPATISLFQTRNALLPRRQKGVGTQLVEATGCSALAALHTSSRVATRQGRARSPSSTSMAIDLISGSPPRRAIR